MQRFGQVIGLKDEKLEEYKQLHADAWPEVLDRVAASNIRNFSIFLRKLPDGKHYLFSYFEYVGNDFKADTAKYIKKFDDAVAAKKAAESKPADATGDVKN